MEISGQLHAQATLPLGKRPQYLPNTTRGVPQKSFAPTGRRITIPWKGRTMAVEVKSPATHRGVPGFDLRPVHVGFMVE